MNNHGKLFNNSDFDSIGLNMIQVIDRALSIIEYIAREKQAVSLGDISKKVGISSTTCSNIIKDLLQRGYLEQEGHGKGYRIGPMCLGLGQLSDPYFSLRYFAEPVIQRIAEQTGETALISVLCGSKKLVVCFAQGYETIRFALERGVFDDIHWTAGGPLLLAHTTDKQRNWIYQSLNERWADNAEAQPWLQGLPEAVKKAQESECYSCSTPQVEQFAVAVKQNGRVIAAVGVSVPQFRLTEQLRKTVTDQLIAAGEEISEGLDQDLEM